MSIEEYFVFQDDYYILKELNTMLHQAETTFAQLKSYVAQHQLAVNSYLKLKDNVFVPIIYITTLIPTEAHQLFAKWLLKCGADPNLAGQGDCQHILFSCHSKYLPLLKTSGVSFFGLEATRLEEQIRRKLMFGDLERLAVLIQLNLLDKAQLTRAIQGEPELIYQVLDIMIDRIHLICRTHNTKQEVDQVLELYLRIFRLIRPKGSEKLIQFCVGYYLADFLADLADRGELPNPEHYRVVYHEDNNPKINALMRQIFNDHYYVKTCQVLGCEIDARAN